MAGGFFPDCRRAGAIIEPHPDLLEGVHGLQFYKLGDGGRDW